MASWPDKDPDDVADYVIDWTARLVDDSISSSEWLDVEGLELFDLDNDEKTCTAWIRGGTAGTRYSVTNRIQTVGGRTFDKTVFLSVRQQ